MGADQSLLAIFRECDLRLEQENFSCSTSSCSTSSPMDNDFSIRTGRGFIHDKGSY
jgi:hypothetical protein